MTTEIPPIEHTGQPAAHAEEFSMCFTSTPRGARLARRLVSHRLDVWGFPYESEVNETVTLVVAELTANAATHGRVPGRDFRLSLTLAAARDLVCIEVTDTRDGDLSLARPCVPQDPEAEEGRGLWLVSSLASRLSVGPRKEGGPGKTVRAELDLCGKALAINQASE
ncbi:ATP-binding protein [Streptomyces cellulosae]|uniref:ATP-binding protein n=1 Tax=Streptomyces TaxID=1883 RepID=UPI0013690EDF|nr:ATP-binding protein [Streptomyces cellulosae]MYQ30983.1 ATP-binding protein [Streptomyces sp. SID4956]WTB83302.1 ATP-binding protein [Streptomyces cellulosae]WTC57504.1 ATP-binding protein [Streptomyces cellulosae]